MDTSTSYPHDQILGLVVHPFQISKMPMYSIEEKEEGRDYYIRIDMPGISTKQDLSFLQGSNERQMRVLGNVARNKIHGWSDFERAYTCVIDLNRKQSEIDIEHFVVNGCVTLIIHDAKAQVHTLQVGSAQNTVNTINCPGDHITFGNHGTTWMDQQNRARLGKLTLPPEAYSVNPFISRGPTGCVIHKFAKPSPSKFVLYVLMECPGLADFDFSLSSHACTIAGPEEEDKDEEVLKCERTYFWSMKFDCGCCRFDVKGTKKTDQKLSDGLLLLKLRGTTT